jgi:DNA adenine methyltransferase
MILIETAASTAIRASTSMKTRKVAKQHQNVLVFYKGNPREVTKHFPPIELSKDEEEALDNLIAQTTAVEDDD